MQAQRGGQTCPRSHSKEGQAGPEPGLPGAMLSPSPVQQQNFLFPTLTSRGINGSYTFLGELQLLQNHTIEGCCNSKKDWGSLLQGDNLGNSV